MEFCKAYNAATENQRGNVIPVEITVYEDRSFTFEPEDPARGQAVAEGRRCAEGLGEPHKTKVAKVTWDQVREIAETKKEDLNANDIDRPAKIIAGHRPVDGHHGRVVRTPWESLHRLANHNSERERYE
jgi:large subunit ribosomal protein L11